VPALRALERPGGQHQIELKTASTDRECRVNNRGGVGEVLRRYRTARREEIRPRNASLIE
jgi:hypothetical protein